MFATRLALRTNDLGEQPWLLLSARIGALDTCLDLCKSIAYFGSTHEVNAFHAVRDCAGARAAAVVRRARRQRRQCRELVSPSTPSVPPPPPPTPPPPLSPLRVDEQQYYYGIMNAQGERMRFCCAFEPSSARQRVISMHEDAHVCAAETAST